MVVGIVCELEYVGRVWDLVLSRIPIVCSVFLENGVGVGSDILVRVDSDEGGGSHVGVDGVGHKALAETGDGDEGRGSMLV